MAKRKSDHTTELVAGIVGGFLMGSILGVWYAPQSGEQTIEKVKRTITEPINKVKAKIQGETITDSIEQGRALAHHNRARDAKPVVPSIVE